MQGSQLLIRDLGVVLDLIPNSSISIGTSLPALVSNKLLCYSEHVQSETRQMHLLFMQQRIFLGTDFER